ncbi:hypothetical protein B0H15DRAFT_807666 [Mycena belliarum]|uniref:Uncharacterized protein n=1 Tax=Mycena belliarum TaxID=1033014 RepID=A0AAD6TLN2_9AGAR|nr:hypothetical protein B0H15DRAFT_807666 [Mycena belliae]
MYSAACLSLGGVRPSLASILTALPIQPSTRDTIIQRLSYDSTASSYSDRDEGHELDDVRRGASLDSVFSPEHETPRAKFTASPARTHARTVSASESLAYGGGGAQYRRAGPPRTEQLEPWPAMQLPLGTLRRKAGAVGDFDLLGLGNGEGEGETVDLDL